MLAPRAPLGLPEHPASPAGRVNPPRGRAERLEEGGRSPRAAAVRAVASFLQLLLFWAKLEASGTRRPSRPSAPAAVRSPRGATRRCRPAGPRAAMRGSTHAHVRSSRARSRHAGDPPSVPPAPAALR